MKLKLKFSHFITFNNVSYLRVHYTSSELYLLKQWTNHFAANTSIGTTSIYLRLKIQL